MRVVGSRQFGDHHAFTTAEVDAVVAGGRRAGAGHVLTTEKDWVKLSKFAEVRSAGMPFVRLAIELVLDEPDAALRSIELEFSRRTVK